MVLIQYGTVRKYVHVFIFFKNQEYLSVPGPSRYRYGTVEKKIKNNPRYGSDSVLYVSTSMFVFSSKNQEYLSVPHPCRCVNIFLPVQCGSMKSFEIQSKSINLNKCTYVAYICEKNTKNRALSKLRQRVITSQL